MKGLLSMGVPGANMPGYLLIELMIALVAITVCALLVAQLQVYIAHHNDEAEQYLTAVSYASELFEHCQCGRQKRDAYMIETTMQPVKELPFAYVAVTVSWKTARGVSQTITIHGGMLHAENNT